jgi:hypothetical protein
MWVTVESDISDVRRLQQAILKRRVQIAQQIANLAASNAASARYNEGMTPNVEYNAEVSIHGDTVIGELSAEPGSEGADINLRIALGGRKAYTITTKPPGRPAKSGSGRPGVMLWPAGSKGDPIDGVAKVVHKKAIAPALGGQFMRKAMANAIQQVRNRYR